jgi:TetR/AcrR family transcriptional repressor of nem operon
MARPREFDESDALRAAMRTFWTKGYEATSITDLTEAMNVSRSTLYASFGEKDQLFDRAVALYTEEVSNERYRILRDAKSVRQGLRDFFQHHIDTTTAGHYPGGCLIVNTAVGSAGVPDRVARFVSDRAAAGEKAIRDLLARGQASGEIARKKDIDALARMLVATAYGIHVLGRMKRNRRNLQPIVDAALAALD